MHFVVAAIGILAAAYFWTMRARNAAEMTSELMDVAGDVRSAMRRFGFRRRHDLHPVDSVEDPKVAMATVAVSFMELHGMPSEETRGGLLRRLQSELDVSSDEAEELMILGRWLMNECNGPSPAIARAAKRLMKLPGRHLEPLLELIKSVAADPMSDQQRDALGDIQTALRIR